MPKLDGQDEKTMARRRPDEGGRERARDPEAAMRAARLSRVPGVTIAQACARFDVARSAVSRARKRPESRPSLAEIALAALSRNGLEESGRLDGLAEIAGWIDYINHDGCDEDGARRLLDEMVAAGILAIAGDRWRLVKPWP